MTSETTEPEKPAPLAGKSPWLKIGIVVGGLAVAVSLMVLVFLAPSINSGADDLPVGISGPAQATAQLQQKLEAAQPGAFDFKSYDDAAAVVDATHDRDVVGGISIETDGSVKVTVAGGAGTPYAQLLKTLGASLASAGQKVSYTDVAPLTADDPNGSGLSALGLPLAFGGMISAVLLSTLLKNQPLYKIAGSLAGSTVVGFVVVAILQFGFGSVDGNYFLTALSLSLGVAAISLFVLGMESLLGYAGFGVGGLVMMFIANPLSGMATGWQWLPSPWGFIGQLLPIGSSGTLIRSVAFFDGEGIGMPLSVLFNWVIVGVALTIGGGVKKQQAAVAA
ncbi:hypothetical protein M2359_000951 [Gordonia amarae]|nr:hypothetical protein [Gordonia amarae]MCS3877322.1 hypothetical protein [Gordonia amarae]